MREKAFAFFILALSILFGGCGSWTDFFGMIGETPSVPIEKGIVVKVLDVGQGDAILIRTPEQTVLVDTSDTNEGHRLQAALSREGVKKIDKLIITHPHRDHIGGASVIFRTYKVRAVYDNGQPTSTNVYRNYLKTIQKREIPYQSLRDGDVLELGGGAILRVLSPTQEMVDNRGIQDGKINLNLNSIVARLEYGKFTMMLTGDAETIAEAGILERHASESIQSHVLKAGHHGSKTSSSPEFLKALDAEVALISCGEQNEYHCPHPSVLARYRQFAMDYYRTDENGTITIKTDGETYTVQTERGGKNDGEKVQ